MSKGVNLKKYIDEIILEVEKEIEEETSTGNVDGYSTPNAFGDGSKSFKKKVNSISTEAGYTIVNEARSIDFAYIIKNLKQYKSKQIDFDGLVDAISVDLGIKQNSRAVKRLGQHLHAIGDELKYLNNRDLKGTASELLDMRFENINESAYKSATNNELAQYIINLSNEISGEKDSKKVKWLKKDREEVKKELKSRKNVNESVKLTDISKLANAQDKGNLDTLKLNKPFNVLTKTGITKVTPIPVTSMAKGKFVRTMHFKVGQKQYVRLSGVVKHLGITENVNESVKIKIGDTVHVRPEKRKTTSIGKVTKIGKKDSRGNISITFKQKNGEEWDTDDGQVRKLNGKTFVREDCDKPKRKNRWLELKNDESMHTNKKLSVGMMNMRNQLKEVEKYLGWYNKLKNVNEVEAQTYFKRTVSNIRKIKERIVNIAKKIQELEKDKEKPELSEKEI